jgi:outer membrane biosynthesis protein TonB
LPIAFGLPAELIGSEDGTFVVRGAVKDGVATQLLTVVYKGKPTHHQLGYSGGFAMVNKKPFGEKKTVEALLLHLATPGVKGWPVPLTNPVAKGSAAAPEPEVAAVAEPQSAPEPVAVAEPEPPSQPEPEPASQPEPATKDNDHPAVTNEMKRAAEPAAAPEPEPAPTTAVHPAVTNEKKKGKKKAAAEEEETDNFGKVRPAGFAQHTQDTVISPTPYNDAHQYGDKYWADKRAMARSIAQEKEAEVGVALWFRASVPVHLQRLCPSTNTGCALPPALP